MPSSTPVNSSSFEVPVGCPQVKHVEETSVVLGLPLASTISCGVTLDLLFFFPAVSLASGSRVSIPSSPFSISPTGGGEPFLTFFEENPLIDQVSPSQGDDIEVLLGPHANVPMNIPLPVPPKSAEEVPI